MTQGEERDNSNYSSGSLQRQPEPSAALASVQILRTRQQGCDCYNVAASAPLDGGLEAESKILSTIES